MENLRGDGNVERNIGGRAFAISAGACVVALCVALGAQAQTAPKCKYDPDWPKPLPNK
jgi:hypothetical protein